MAQQLNLHVHNILVIAFSFLHKFHNYLFRWRLLIVPNAGWGRQVGLSTRHSRRSPSEVNIIVNMCNKIKTASKRKEDINNKLRNVTVPDCESAFSSDSASLPKLRTLVNLMSNQENVPIK